MQSACTPKELRELLQIVGPNLHVDPEAMQTSAFDEAELKASRIRRRVFETLSKAAAQASPSPRCTLPCAARLAACLSSRGRD